MANPSDPWMRQFLRSQAQRQASMLGLLMARLERDLKADTQLPSESWLRAARIYQDGYRMIAHLELETAKVQLMARRVAGRAPLTDAEYEQQMRELGQEALRGLTDEQVEEERARRHRLPAARDEVDDA